MPKPIAVPYRSALQTDAKPFNPELKKFPLPKNSGQYLSAYQFLQNFCCRLKNVFPPAPLNTPSNSPVFGLDDSNAILTEYSEPQALDAGLGNWSATFTRIPAPWDDFQSYTFVFPSWIGLLGAPNTREVLSTRVTARHHHEYFLIDPNNLAAGVADSAGNAVTRLNSMGAIPVIRKNNFVATYGGQIIPSQIVNHLVSVNGFSYWNGQNQVTETQNPDGSTTTVITPIIVTYYPTVPSIELYQKWLANAQPFLDPNNLTPWDQTHPSVWDGVNTNMVNTVGQIIAEDSWTQIYAGNIIERITPYVLVR